MADQRFCHNCGTQQSEDASFCLQCGASSQPVSQGECPQCGQENDRDDQFCGECGTSLAAAPAGYRNTPNDSQELPMVELPRAITSGYKKYFTFRGRARRSEYWWWILFTFLVSLVFWIPIVGWLANLSVIIPTISLTTRRLHDSGLSGWCQLGPWAPLLIFLLAAFTNDWQFDYESEWMGWLGGAIILSFIFWIVLFVMMLRKGNLGPNRYGPDPRQPGSN